MKGLDRVALLVAAVVAASVLLPARPGLACSCIESSHEPHGDAVFYGTVTDVEEPPQSDPNDPESSFADLIWTVDVEAVQRGSLDDVVTVRSNRQGAMCGFPMEVGSRYHIFATVDSSGVADYHTHLCTASHRVSASSTDPPRTMPSVPAVVRGTAWYLRDAQTTGHATHSFSYGSGGIPLFGDWDGDGTATPGWFRDGVWLLRNETDPGPADVVLRFGRAGDLPVVGDWNGDRNFTSNLGVVRPTAQGLRWFLESEEDRVGRVTTDGRADVIFDFGRRADLPVTGRWLRSNCFECVATDHVGVVRRSDRGLIWYLERDRNGRERPTSDGRADLALAYGSAARGDRPVVGDWDGDFVDNVGVLRGDNLWLLELDTTRDSAGEVTGSDGAHDHAFRYGDLRRGDLFVTWRLS